MYTGNHINLPKFSGRIFLRTNF